MSDGCPITRGLPQGGVLSPFLWLLYFDDLRALIRPDLQEWEAELRDIDFLDIFFADDIALAIAHKDPEIIARVADSLARTARGRLLGKHLALCDPKSFNFAGSPGGMEGGIFRRAGGLSKTGHREMPRNDGLIERGVAATTSEDDLPSMYFPPSFQKCLPYTFTDTLKNLGVLFGKKMRFSCHIEGMLGRAGIRHGVMAKLAGSSWVLEVDVLRSTHSALLTSMTRYSIVTYGSGAYGCDLRQLGTLHASVSARRITGIAR